MAAKGGEDRDVGIDPERVIAPMSGGDQPAVEVEDALQFRAVESRNRAPVPRGRERRDDTQALFALGRGWSVSFNAFSSLRSACSSCSSSPIRVGSGSQSS